MRKRGSRIKIQRGIPSVIHRGMVRTNREASSWSFSRPMRNVLLQLRSGVVNEIAETGEVFIDMQTVDSTRSDIPEIVPIGGAIHGWVCVCERLDQRLKTYFLRTLADRLNAGQEITERLVDQAFEEFESIVAKLPNYSPDALQAAAKSAEITALLERVQEAA